MNGNAALFNLQPYHPVSDTDVCLDDLITKHGFDLVTFITHCTYYDYRE